MDSRLHTQRNRNRLRISRPFSPAQYVQQQLPPPPPPPPYHASAMQHRLSLVEEQYAGMPLERCDYASILAYRERLNGFLSPHPAGMVSHVTRNQNAVWSQERLQGFHSTDSRLAPSDDYNRQGSFGRDYRVSRDDLQSLSELDSSRRSAALSAKLFLDDVRPGPSVFQRGTPFESASPMELNRHRIPMELNRHRIEREDPSDDLLLTKASQQNPRKRNREEDSDIDRDRVGRHRRFHDPGLAVLPRTPEASRDYPFVQRMLSSGRFVESEDHQDCHTISNQASCLHERLLASPSKSIKKRPLTQRRKTLPSDMRYLLPSNAPCSTKRSDEAKEKLSGVKDPVDIHLRTREAHFFEEGARDNKFSSSSPSASHFKKDNGAGFADDNRLNSFDNAKTFKLHSASRTTTKGTLDKDQEVGPQKSKQRLAARSLSSIQKALRAVEATPRSKNLKSRVIRLLGSDAKVCGASPKSRQGGQEAKGEVAPQLQNRKGPVRSGCKAIEQDKGSSQQKESKELHRGVKIKQEQLALTDMQSKHACPQVQPPELPVSSPSMQCELSADGGTEALHEHVASDPVNLHQLGLEKQQILVSSESVLSHSRLEEVGTPRQHAKPENSDRLIACSAGTQPSIRLMSQPHEFAQKEQSPVPSLLSLNVNIDADDLERRLVKDQVAAMPNSLVSLNSQLLKQVMPMLPDCCTASTNSYNSHGIQNTGGPNSCSSNQISRPSLFQIFNHDLPVSVMLKFAGEACMENRLALVEVQNLFSNTEVSVMDSNETTAEREVRLFGKSLKAPVAKVSLDNNGSSTPLSLSLDRIQKPVLPIVQLAIEQQGTLAGQCIESIGTDIDACLVPMSNVASKEGEALGGSQTIGKGATAVPPYDLTMNPELLTSEVAVEKQETLPSSPNKSIEAALSAFHGMVSEPLSSPSVLATEQQVGSMERLKEVVEATSDTTLNIGARSATTIPDLAADLASEQQADVLGSQATTNACAYKHIHEQEGDVLESQATDARIDIMKPAIALDLAPEQQICTDARESMPTKASAQEEHSFQSEVVLKHGGKLEAFFSDKPANYTPSKQVAIAPLHPQGRLPNMPGWAVANTWRRASSSNGLFTSQAMPKVPKQLVIKPPSKIVTPKVSEAAAYVRKGNSLVRAPISIVAGVSTTLNTGVSGIGKDLSRKELTVPHSYPGFKNTVRNTKSALRQGISAQKMVANEAFAKTQSHDKLSALNLEGSQEGQCIGSVQVGVKSALSEGQLHSSICTKTKGADESISLLAGLEANDSEPSATVQPRPVLPRAQAASTGSKVCETISTLYVKSKANQLVAALPTKTPQVTSAHLNPNDLYYKRNNNQLVRNGSEMKKQTLQDQKSKGETHAAWHSTVRKAIRRRAYLPSSRVWTLKDGSSSQVKSVLPLLFPWKRPGCRISFCAGRFKALPKAKKGSLLFFISKRLQRLRKVQPVYSRSAGGFSLHRSGLLSLSGANLKWTKSIEKRSKQASEEATKAVAEVEKQRRKEMAAVAVVTNAVSGAKLHRRMAREASRERARVVTIGLARYKMDPLGRTLQRLPDQWCGTANASLFKQSTDSAILSTPRRVSFDGTEYVRIGNGHQLVRDPKAASRALANEKVRWSLHTVRSRHAKRQQYCLFFTRFGKCNKREGDCPYIHDAEKIAVCTKFLKGTCLGINCLFSHKVIPERMPDCSFFLEGMCTNEECPYRHVNVNPKAPICEGFLKGFCSEGDECNKKHTTVCPTFSATGECPDKSTCRLHHPKKNGKRVSNGNFCKLKTKKRRRYFGIDNVKSDQHTDEICVDKRFVSFSVDSSTMEFIEIPQVVNDLEENDDFKRKWAFLKEHLPALQSGLQEEADMLIKPNLLLSRAVSA